MANIYKKLVRVFDQALGRQVKQRSAKWWGRYRDSTGKDRRTPLSTDKAAAQAMLNDIVQKEERKRAGIRDTTDEHLARPLSEHLLDFEQQLRTRNRTPKHVDQTVQRVRVALQGIDAVKPSEINAENFSIWLEDLRNGDPRDQIWLTGKAARYQDIAAAFEVSESTVHYWKKSGAPIQARKPSDLAVLSRWYRSWKSRGVGPETLNGYITAMRMLCRWMVRTRRLRENPLLNLSKEATESDRRHERRSLLPDELARFVASTETADNVMGFDGETRALVYCMAARTGLRRSEIASLTLAEFDLDGRHPTVTIRAAAAKNRKSAILPLHSEVVTRLTAWLARTPVTGREKLFPGLEETDTAEMVRRDLERIGIDYKDPDGRVFDFHALRGQLASDCARYGVPLATAQKLMRHSDPRLTANSYTKLAVVDLGAAVESIASTTASGDAFKRRQQNRG